LYDQLLFSDLFPGQGFIPMRHVGNVPHRVMALCIETLEQRWEEVNHPLYKLFFHTHHPDIVLAGMRQMSAAKSIRHSSGERQDRLRA
ncbi:MAG: hypothetical protein V4447_12120, partial [Pseudomonadota bacterium]